MANLHPFAPVGHSTGYRAMIDDLERWLGEITGFDGVEGVFKEKAGQFTSKQLQVFFELLGGQGSDGATAEVVYPVGQLGQSLR